MAPFSFRRRSWKPSLDKVEKSFETDRYSNLCDLSVSADGSRSPPVQPASDEIVEGVANGSVKRCVSMLELSELRDMQDFGKALDAIGRHAHEGAAPRAGRDDEQDFLLIESSDRIDGIDEETIETMEGLIVFPSCGSSGRMRRSTSMASFHSSDNETLCLSSSMVLQRLEKIDESFYQSHRNNAALESDVEGGYAVDVKSNDEDKEKPSSAPFDTNHMDTPCLKSRSNGSNELLHDLEQKNTSECTNDYPSSLKTFHGKDCSRLRNVSFSSLEIRSYNLTLGDAPTSKGPAISLDWEYDPQSTVVQIDDYENERRSTRRSKHEMLMPPSYRQYLLMREAGFTRGEIQRAVDQARRLAKERERTRRNLALQPVEEVLETAKKKFGRLVRRSS
ncbi:hypothetical protein ACHAW6_010551 [Cyclotella cf. meneghiniana]